MDQDELIKKIYDYQSEKMDKLDWPYHNLLIDICSEIIDIVEGCR